MAGLLILLGIVADADRGHTASDADVVGIECGVVDLRPVGDDGGIDLLEQPGMLARHVGKVAVEDDVGIRAFLATWIFARLPIMVPAMTVTLVPVFCSNVVPSSRNICS